jgi:hypothetical protein
MDTACKVNSRGTYGMSNHVYNTINQNYGYSVSRPSGEGGKKTAGIVESVFT